MSIIRTRRANGAPADTDEDRAPALFDDENDDPSFSSIEGVTLDSFVMFMAKVGMPDVPARSHDEIAQQLGFPAGRYDLIRNAWMLRVYNSPALAREFGLRLDTARTAL